MLLFLILLMAPLSGMGIDLYTPSLPALVQFFHTHPSLVKLTIVTYLIGFAVAQPIFGTLSDHCGRKKTLLLGAVLYVVASFAAIFSYNIHILLLMRLLQGIAGASISVVGKAVVSDSFEGEAAAKVFTYYTIAWALGPIIAPAIGGYLQFYFGWQAAFYFFTTYGLILLILLIGFLPETIKHKNHFNLPLIVTNYKSMLTHGVFMSGLISMGLLYAALIVFNVVGPFLIQVVLHYSVITYGHIALGMGFGFFLGTFSSRLFIAKKLKRDFSLISLCVMLTISLLMALYGIFFGTTLLTTIIPVFLIFYTAGIVYPRFMSISLSLFKDMAGSASAIAGSFICLAAALVAIFASMFHFHNQIFLGFVYIVLSGLCLAIYLIWLRPDSDTKKGIA